MEIFSFEIYKTRHLLKRTSTYVSTNSSFITLALITDTDKEIVWTQTGK
jgi:hypothetical protein